VQTSSWPKQKSRIGGGMCKLKTGAEVVVEEEVLVGHGERTNSVLQLVICLFPFWMLLVGPG
jgi:hypothetical protein